MAAIYGKTRNVPQLPDPQSGGMSESDAWNEGNRRRNSSYDGTLPDTTPLSPKDQGRIYAESRAGFEQGMASTKPKPPAPPMLPDRERFGVLKRDGIDPKTGKEYGFVGTTPGGLSKPQDTYEDARQLSQNSRAQVGQSTPYQPPVGAVASRGFGVGRDAVAPVAPTLPSLSPDWMQAVQSDIATRAEARDVAPAASPQLPAPTAQAAPPVTNPTPVMSAADYAREMASPTPKPVTVIPGQNEIRAPRMTSTNAPAQASPRAPGQPSPLMAGAGSSAPAPQQVTSAITGNPTAAPMLPPPPAMDSVAAQPVAPMPVPTPTNAVRPQAPRQTSRRGPAGPAPMPSLASLDSPIDFPSLLSSGSRRPSARLA